MTLQATTNNFNIQEIGVPTADVSDEEIIKKIKTMGFIAYGSIVRRYNQRMFRVARSIITDDATAMDIVQEAHIKAYTKIDSFQGKSSFAAWIAGITRNEALMHLRKHKKEVTMGEDEQSKVGSLTPNISDEIIQNQPDSVLANSHMQTLINKNLDKLSEKFRSVFVLRAVEQFSTKETAKILNINEITVKTRYFRSKRFLRNEIQNHLGSSELNVYEFGNKNCDLVLIKVLKAISSLSI